MTLEQHTEEFELISKLLNKVYAELKERETAAPTTADLPEDIEMPLS